MRFSPSKTHGFRSSSTHKSPNQCLEQVLAKTHHKKVREEQGKRLHYLFGQEETIAASKLEKITNENLPLHLEFNT